MDVPALTRCVGDVDSFFDRYWSRAPLLLETSEGFDDLASLDGLDEVIASLGLRASSLRMVQDGKTLPVSSYTTPPGSKSRTSDPLVIAAAVYERFSEGATIVIESLHRFWRPLTDFCRELELSLGHRLQVNAYVTPPGSQGFDVHRDGHDVFVLQVSGAKHWIVYDDGDEERVLIDQEIRRGAALYIPRGFPHAASAGSSASAHLTVGILTHDSIDVLREITKLAEREPIFKGPLPLGSTLDPDALREVVTSHVEELQAWLDKVDLDELTRRVARKTMSSSQSLVRGQLRQLELVDSINADTELAPRPGTTCTLFPGDTELRVLLVDRELQMPLAATVAMQAIAGRERMKVSDLHPYLTEDSALVLARRLVREGLLEVVVGD